MLKTLAGVGVSMLALATPALASPPDRIYEFTVITDTVQTPPICGYDGLPPCTFTEGQVPYRLATLTLTHDALTKHQARLSDMTDPSTDDGRVISFTLARLPGLDGEEAPGALSIPEADPYCPSNYPDRLFE